MGWILLLAFAAAGIGLLLGVPSAAATPLSGANVDMDKMCNHVITGYATKTASANDAVASDVQLGDNALGTGADFGYYGMSNPFQRLVFNIGTAGVTGTVAWTYWDGNSWEALAVTDGTDNFRNAGSNTVTFTPPGDWATTQIDATLCSGSYYFVRTATGTLYSTVPRSTQISAVHFNLKVKAQDELGTVLTGLGTTGFIVGSGTTNTVYTSREIGGGVYELALDTLGADRDFNVQTQKDGYVTSTAVASGTVSATLTDISGSAPMSLKFSLKVTPDDELSGSTAMTGATVTAGNSFGVTCVEPGTPDGNYYCAIPLAHTGTDVKIAKDGYVTKTLSSAFGDRTAHSASQSTAPERVKTIGANLPSGTSYGSAAYDGSNFYIFGGNDGSLSNKVYRYNPGQNTITLMAATLPTAREGTGAVWDSSNSVAYIFGGNDGSAKTDILKYDPATDTITDTGYTLPTATDHMCAAWDSTNNKAYVFGGWTLAVSTQIIRFTPGSGVATETATLPAGRTACSAVYDGSKMWVFGGWGGVALNDIVKWTPGDASTSTSTTLLPQTLEDTSAVYNTATGYAYIFGGYTGTALTDDIVRFKTSDETVSTMSEALPTARKKMMAGWDVTNSRAYLAGGDLASGRSDQVVRYTPASASVITTPVLPQRRMPGASVYHGSYAYTFGGVDGSTYYSDVVQFDTSTSVVTTKTGTLPTARTGLAAASDGSNIYIFGGYDGSSYLNTILKYNSGTDTLTTLAATLPSGRAFSTAVWDSVASRIYIFGGQTSGAAFTTQILSFDPSGSGSISTLSPTLPTAGGYMSSIFDGTNAYVFGGYANGASGFSTIVKFNPTAVSVTTMSGALPTARYWASAVWDGSNAYIFGGSATDNDDILRYTPSIDTVTNMDTLYPNDKFSAIRYGTTAVWDGAKTYIFGGESGSARLNEIVRYDRTVTLDLQFAVKVTGVATEGPANSLTTVTVTTGDSFGTSCTESSGAWYCAVPLANTGVAVKVVKDGYVTKEAAAAFTDRTAATDAQATPAITGVQFAYKVTGVTTEGPASGLTTVTVTTGDSYGTTCAENSGAWYCAVPLANTEVAVKAAKDGYVTKTVAAAFTDRTAATDAQGTVAVTSYQFAYKITGVTAEGAGASLSTVTVTTGNSFGTTCSESSGAWYCAVPVADAGVDVKAAKDGYVTRTVTSALTDRTAATDAQATGSVSSVQFAYKVTGVTDELSNSLTTVTVSAGNAAGTACTESSGAWYCAVPLADSTLTIQAAKDGYVTNSGSSFGSDRTAATDAQVTGTVSTVRFAFKVTGVADELGTALSAVTVKAGNAQGTTCSESGSAWYCAVPLADTTLTIQAAKDGYVTNTGTSFGSDRTAATNAQVTASVTGALFAFKVTSVTPEVGSALTTGTVVAGNSFGTTCSGSGGAWYCPVPLANTELTIRYSKDGYVTHSGTSFASDRTAATDAQGTAAVSSVLYTVKITVTSESDLNGVTFQKKVGAGSYADLAYTASSTNVAYFAQTTSEADVVFRAFEDALSGDTGAAFTATASSQTSKSVAMTTCTQDCAISDLTATGTSLVAGASTTYTFSFQIPPTWPADGTFVATFPSGYTLAATPGCTLTAATGSCAATSSSLTATATRSGGAATAGLTTITVALTSVTNPPVSGATGTFTVALKTSGGTTLASGTASAVTITAGSLSSVTASASPTVAGASSTYTFGFTGANAWPATGKLFVTFPSGFAVSSPTCTVSGADGSCSGSASGLDVTLTRSGGAQTSAGTAITVAVSGVTNPTTAGSSGTFTLKTRTSGSVDIDTGSAAAVTIISGSLTGLTTSAASLVTSTETTYTFGFTTVNAWPASGKLTVDFPSDHTLGSPTVTFTGASGSGSVSVSGQTVTITRSGGSETAAATAVTAALTAITNPTTAGTTGTFTLTLQTSSGTSIDSGVTPAVTLTLHTLAVSGLTSSSHPASTWKASTTLSASWTVPAAAVSGYSWGVDADPDNTIDGTSPSASVSSLASGTHTFRVKAQASSGGTWGPIITYSNIYVDPTAPTAPSISSGSHASGTCTAATSGSFYWSASDATSGLDATQPYGYSLDGAAEVRTASASYFPTSLADGSHTLRVAAYDRAANSQSATYTFKVDLNAPSAALSPASATSNGTSVALAWSASEACGTVTVVSIEYRYADGSWQSHSAISTSTATPSGTLTFQFTAADGAYDFRARAQDSTGNIGSFPGQPHGSVVRDRVVPSIPTNVRGSPQPQGYVQTSWSASTDDRTGIAGYNVYRIDDDGSRVKVNAALVTATQYSDGPYPHGRNLRYEVRAQDVAGNLGGAGASATTQGDSQGPASAPTGLAVLGLQAGLLSQPQVFLAWDSMTGITDFAVDRGGVRIGTTVSNSFDAANAPDGSYTYTVVSRDEAGNEGPPASITFVKDAGAPASKATAPAESGPAIYVTWTAQDLGVGVAKVQLWVLEDGQTARTFFESAKPDGSVSFYGVEGHTYYFIALGTDGIGHAESKMMTTSAADASTRVTSSVVRANEEAMRLAQAGGGGGSPNGTPQPFYVEDKDHDGFPETFVDPNQGLATLRIVPVDGTDNAFLLGTRGGQSDSPVILWSPASGGANPVVYAPQVKPAQVTETEGGRLVKSVTVDKGGWIYIAVDDDHPERLIETVLRADGSELPRGYHWRQANQVIILDDPSFEYRVVYGPLGANDPWQLVIAALAAFVLSTGGWITWPSRGRLLTRPIPPNTLRWALRHCGACHEPLPRIHRLSRRLHTCSSALRRIQAQVSVHKGTLASRLEALRHLSTVIREGGSLAEMLRNLQDKGRKPPREDAPAVPRIPRRPT